jgi:diguanylate cyclase (GGDEF)-like protein/PAS domain S-box-containing protein
MQKLTLHSVLSPSVFTVTTDTALPDVLASMESLRISCVIAIDVQHHAIGIFTEQDAIALMAERKDVAKLSMSDVMSTSLLTAPADMDFRDAYQLMSGKGYRHLIVADDDNRLIGIVSEGDFLHHMGMEYLVELKTVSAAMTRNLVTLKEDATLADAVDLMARHKISCVIITRDQVPIGILTERDTIGLVRTINDPARVHITRVMKSPVQTIDAQHPLQQAMGIMESFKIRRLVVVEGDILKGIVTRHDIVKNMQGRYIEFLHETLERQRNDLHHAQEQIAETHQLMLYQSLMEQTNDAIFVLRAENGAIIECNTQACKSLGYTLDEILRLRVVDIDANFSTDHDWKAEHEITAREGKRLVETQHKRRDGSTFPVEISARIIERNGERYIVAVARDLTERKQIEATLSLKNTALNSTANAIVITDKEGIIEWANPAFTEMTGYSLDEALGKSPKELVNSGIQTRAFYEVLWNTILSGQVWRGEVVNNRKDGTHYTEEMTITPVYTIDKIITHFIAVKQDISERKAIEIKLEQSEVTYRDILNNLTEAILVLDENGTIVDVNRGSELLYQYSREELLGLTAWSVLDPVKNDMQDLQARLQQVFAGTPISLEMWGVKKNGEVFPKASRASKGKYFGREVILVVSRDISERKTAELKLSQSESAYRGILNSMTEAVYIQAADGTFLDVNPGVEMMYGYTREELIGKTPAFLSAPDKNDIPAVIEAVKQAFAGIPQQFEYWGKRKDGTIFPKSVSLVNGEYFGQSVVIAVARDIREQKAFETAIKTSETRYRSLVESAPFPVVIVDDELSTVTFANHPAESLFELDYAKAAGALASNFYVHPKDRDRIVARQKAGEVVKAEVVELRTATGKHIWVMMTTASGIFNGRLSHIATLFDITEHRNIEEEMRTSRAMLQQILDTAPLSIFWKDRNSVYLGCNNAFAKDANIPTAASIIGKDDFEMPWLRAEAEAYRADDAEVMSNDHPKKHIIESQLQADGKTIWLDTSKVPLKDKEGKVFGVLGLYQNITDKKQAEEKLELRESYLTAIIENQPGLIWLKDLKGRYLAVNQKFSDAAGEPSPDAVIGKSDFDYWPPELAKGYLADDTKVMQTKHSLSLEEKIIVNGQPTWHETFKTPAFNNKGDIIGTTGMATDITLRRKAEDQLREAAAVMQNTHEGVLITDASSVLLAVNPAFTRMTGYTEAEVLGRNPRLLNSGRQDSAFYQALWKNLLEQGFWQGELWNRRKNGEIYPQLLSISAIRDDSGQPTRYLGVFADITQIKENQAKLEFMAHHDPLTKLPNRALAESRLEQELEQAHRHDQQLSVLFIDLDRFKQVNDSFGHLVGDELLCAVAKRLLERLREGDTLGRLGGDEFILIASPLQDKQDAAIIARDFINALSEPFRLSNSIEVFIGGSIGISLFPDNGTTVADLTKNADAAMYLAKENGRNQFSFYTSALNADSRKKLELENDLRRAVLQDDLQLHFQPKVDIRTGFICGAEALARWQKSDGTWIPPSDFIPLAEKSGVILTIGNRVLEQTCAQMRIWMDAGLPDVCVALNVSARQFRSGHLDKLIKSALQNFNIPPHCLELELTESMLMHEPDRAIATMHKLKKVGVKLSLDDFGTGYSNFSYLRRFPIDSLKIDQSFVQGITTSAQDAMIVDSIIGLAQRMKLRVVGEGVESNEQLAYLSTRGCDELQGYLFSKALPADEFAALVKSGKQLEH